MPRGMYERKPRNAEPVTEARAEPGFDGAVQIAEAAFMRPVPCPVTPASFISKRLHGNESLEMTFEHGILTITNRAAADGKRTVRIPIGNIAFMREA